MFILCILWLVNSEKLLNYWIQNWISILYLYNPSSQFSSEVSVKYLWPLYLQYASKYNTFDHSKPMFQDVSSFLDIVCHSSRNKNLLVHSNLSNDSWIGGIKSDVRTTCSDQTEITQSNNSANWDSVFLDWPIQEWRLSDSDICRCGAGGEVWEGGGWSYCRADYQLLNVESFYSPTTSSHHSPLRDQIFYGIFLDPALQAGKGSWGKEMCNFIVVTSIIYRLLNSS